MDFQISPELVAIYLEDARGHLEILDRTLLSLEREGFDPESISSVLGPLHTLKGNSGMMGLTAVKDYIHTLEDVFARMNDGRLRPTASVYDRLLAGGAALRDAVEAACLEPPVLRDLASERATLQGMLSEGDAPPLAPEPRVAPVQRARQVVQPAERAPVAGSVPAQVEPTPPTGSELVETTVGGRRAGDAPARAAIVRVDFAQLDHLLNLVGELIVYRNKLQDAGRRVAAALPGDSASRELAEAIQQLEVVSAQLQEATMDVRMLPIRTVFHRFPRLVRDLARQQGKKIELLLQGEETRVDKAIIDELGEPLVHMIRNSVDHGIETPDVRERRGKSPTGTILLAAAQESNNVVITIVDDGGGLDADEIRRKAVERGLIRPGDDLSDREAVQLIFTAGFSTARTVTEISGRGVGLDVVLRSIEKLGGLVEAESVKGAGTKFIIRLPLTLAIIPALLVEVSGSSFAIPLGSVVESLRFRAKDLSPISGRDTLRIRERIVPLLRLSDVLGMEAKTDRTSGYAVVLGRGEKRLAVAVDRLLGQQEIVIKALDASVSGSSIGMAGATIMGDGRVVLILDVAALFERRARSVGFTGAP